MHQPVTQRRLRRTAVAVLMAAVGAVGLSACNDDHPAPAVTTTVTAPAPTVTVTATPTPTPTLSPSPPASAAAAGKPDVVLTGDPEAASKELDRLKATGWWNPNKIEYADDPVTALQQFDKWLAKGYVAPGGGWTPEGEAAVQAANEGGPEM
ncbi:hypothetical protein GCM10010329_73260 [Streptomyces spiroverticillatus]|uniref:Peptidoglycan-binding protein n=1 Tax=Streptomyces finlayi TaxID=67296 RepID=A0A918X5M3_9ACTN|nr:hypothetical protein [Streptomyces finlayi]GHA39425.1 hypothetical protein GCM10010329_73260 [Streptomyces spiroverticillatus]GHD14306.1 hypothetical protein GCM10010334_73420 [Streptomyces finlayi]